MASNDRPVYTTNHIFQRTTTAEDLTGSQFLKVLWKVEDKDLDTRFYDSFTREEMVWGAGGARNLAQWTTYRIGDTVLLETASREPSVSVVVSIWKVFEGEVEKYTNVRLHWFSRPSDLAQYRPDHPALSVSSLRSHLVSC